MGKKASYTRLLAELRRLYAAEARAHLPWRHTTDPYKILVSEMMLQQTQVDRVVSYYKKWIETYPTAQALAKAKLPAVLKHWQGLGYNRRAKYLHEAAKVLAKEPFTGQKLPGVGPYTRGAVLAFALNKPEVFVETNIRTVIFHSGILENTRILSDAQLLPIVEELLRRSKMQPRDFYAAMMDYGAHLKKQGVKLNSRSKHYAKQGKFEGSARQLRGALLRELLAAPATPKQLQKKIPRTAGEIEAQLTRLRQEGLVAKRAHRYEVAR